MRCSSPLPPARTINPDEPVHWQQALAQAIRQPEALLEALELPGELLTETILASRDFSVCVPQSFLSRMKKADPADPLLLQVLPLGAECLPTAGFSVDPVGDQQSRATAGLLHKYHGRVLLMTTAACAVHCRYCFRRHYQYGEDFSQPPVSLNTISGTRSKWHAALEYININKDITEVILSGGDPLCLSTSQLEALVEDLAAIPHLSRLRIHSRTPIVLPERVDTELIDWLNRRKLNTVIVLHCNHPNELDAHVSNSLSRLQQTGVTLLNQSVLLRNINDNEETLAELSEKLFSASVLPYYLHQLDRVQGAGHFEVDDKTAQNLMNALRARLPGYLVPRLVRENAGEASKQPVI